MHPIVSTFVFAGVILFGALTARAETAEGYFNRGIDDLKQKNYYQAIDDFGRCIKLNPNYVAAYNNRALAHDNLGNYSQAIYDYTKAIELKPDSPRAYNNRALAYFALKDYAKAWEDVQKAQSLGYEVKPEFISTLRKAIDGE